MSKVKRAMNGSRLQLLQQSETGWLASLGNGSPLGTKDGEAISARSPRGGGGSTDFRQATHIAVAENAACKVMFDGVLYNREELNRRLANPSLSRTTNDAELILQAYVRWGEDVLRNIKGIFALLIWDERREVLLCARDPLGVYPLFYADTGRELLFSTSIEALVRHPEVPDAVSRTALADYLAHRPHIPEETFYDAVKRVSPGHAMRVKGRTRHDYRYWNPVPDEAEVDWVSEDELGRFDELLDQAVDRCLHLGRPGIYLSGGLDSVSVAAVATDNSRRGGLPDPLALSVIFPENSEASEGPVQRRVASELGLAHVRVPFSEAAGPHGLLALGMGMSSGWPVPLTNPWAGVYLPLLFEAKRQGCRVILSGGGGDEWLTTGPLYAADLLRNLDFVGLYRVYKSLRQTFGYSRLRVMRATVWKSGARPWLRRAGNRTLRRTAPWVLQWRWRRKISQSTPSWIAPDPGLRREIEERALRSQWEKQESGSFYFSQWDLDHPLATMPMEENFERWRRTGVRKLMPYWDADLVDFLYRTPPELLNRGERSKALVRQTVARRFPGLNFERQKKIFGTHFFTNLMLEEGPRLYREAKGAQALAELGIVDAPALDSALSVLLSGRQPWYEAQRIREIMLLEGWLRGRLEMPLPPTAEVEVEKSLVP
jgi:asparagine synthase (glutamine-hydrolysing)